MPLGRFGVRNEYELGGKELYKNAVENEDSKAILDGVSIAGLVGLLRQLGDLSLFAAEIFHGLQEQVASTASRNRKLVTRVQRAEAFLPSLEKVILSQTSHIHVAYTQGSELHPSIKMEQSHFICKDLPHFIMDSYEECCEPPRLQLLDRFDTSGLGSCFKRYSDPTFFRQASATSEAFNGGKSKRERKAHKIKRKRSWQHSRQLPNSLPDMNNSRRASVSSQTGRGGSSLSQTGSTFDCTFRSDPRHKSNSYNSKENVGFAESFPHPSISNMDENKVKIGENNHLNDHQNAMIGKDVQNGLLIETNVPLSSDITWDEKLELLEHLGLSSGIKDYVKLYPETNNLYKQYVNLVDENNFQGHGLSKHASIPELSALNDVHEERVKPLNSDSFSHKHPVAIFDFDTELTIKKSRVGKVQDLDAANFDWRAQDLMQVNSECFHPLASISERRHASHVHNLVTGNPDSMKLSSNGKFVSVPLNGKFTIGDILETSEDSNWEVETVDRDHVGVSILPVETSDRNHIGINFEGVNNLTVTEWRQYEDTDSEIDNFVDALNTIDSESESDFETCTKEVESEKYICKKNASGDPVGEHECQSRSYNRVDGGYDGLQNPTFPFSLENAKSSKQSESAIGPEQGAQSQISHEQLLQCAASFSGKTQGLDICVNADEIQLQPVCQPIKSSYQASH